MLKYVAKLLVRLAFELFVEFLQDLSHSGNVKFHKLSDFVQLTPETGQFFHGYR
jgi:hypothetical protein